MKREAKEFLNQSERNLAFFEQACSNGSSYVDWQITILGYSGIHLMNAHILEMGERAPISHQQRKDLLDYESRSSNSKLPKAIFHAYVNLLNATRKTRYDPSFLQNSPSFLERYFKECLSNADKLFDYFCEKHTHSFTPVVITSLGINAKEKWNHFRAPEPPSPAGEHKAENLA